MRAYALVLAAVLLAGSGAGDAFAQSITSSPPPSPDTTPPLTPTANTLFNVWLNADGSIKTLSVDLSSGSSQRDQDAAALVKAQWKGKPGADFARINVHWLLPPGQPPVPQISAAAE
jgi:hypothetical protein